MFGGARELDAGMRMSGSASAALLAGFAWGLRGPVFASSLITLL